MIGGGGENDKHRRKWYLFASSDEVTLRSSEIPPFSFVTFEIVSYIFLNKISAFEVKLDRKYMQ